MFSFCLGMLARATMFSFHETPCVTKLLLFVDNFVSRFSCSHNEQRLLRTQWFGRLLFHEKLMEAFLSSEICLMPAI